MSPLLLTGDCRTLLRASAPNAVDAVVCDPPYDLTNRVPDVWKCVACGRVCGGRDGAITVCPRCGGKIARQRSQGGGFMGKDWDATGVAFDPETWRAVKAVMKPGAYLLAFGGSRTFHRLACAIEDAGFELRDTLMWLYGSGMPKGINVGKAFDKAAGAERAVVGRYQPPGMDKPWNLTQAKDERTVQITGGSRNNLEVTAPATDLAKQWDGWNTALKPAWEPIILARKPLIGTVTKNVAAWGTGALNIDGCRIAHADDVDLSRQQRQHADTAGMKRLGDSGFHADHTQPTYNAGGRWPANVLLSHHPDCVPCGTRRVESHNGVRGGRDSTEYYRLHHDIGQVVGYADADGTEEVERWACVPECPVRLLDAQSGVTSTTGKRSQASRDRDVPGTAWATANHRSTEYPGDSGGASRFFFCAKSSTRERNAGLAGMPERVYGLHDDDGHREPGERRNNHTAPLPAANHHPCVKPVALMRWLVRLVTPPGGLILDPFLGSGSTGIAATLEGFRFVGIDLSQEYVEIARRRIAHAEKWGEDWLKHAGDKPDGDGETEDVA